MFWNKKTKDRTAKCQERTLKLAMLSTKLSLLFVVVAIWVGDHNANSEILFKTAVSFFLIAMACFFILVLALVYNKIKLK